MKRIYGLLILAVLVLPAQSALADIKQFTGGWKNTDSNGGLTRLLIVPVGQRISIRAWGRCHPSECVWPEVEGTFYGTGACDNLALSAQAISALFINSFSQRVMIIRLTETGLLEVEVLTQFTDKSCRSNYRRVETFSRVEHKWTDTNALKGRIIRVPVLLEPQ